MVFYANISEIVTQAHVPIYTLCFVLFRRVRKRKASESARAAKRPKVQGKENEEQLYLVSIMLPLKCYQTLAALCITIV